MSRAKCKHPPEHVVTKYDCDGLPDPLELSWRECLDCGTWLPLGPSADDSEAVRIEIRAAELARLKAGAFVTGDVWSGWDAHRNNYDPPPWPYCPDAWAGYLARCIVTHEREVGEAE